MYDHVAAFRARIRAARTSCAPSTTSTTRRLPSSRRHRCGGPQDVEEFEFVRAHTRARREGASSTGAYTMEDWSYDEHYGHEGGLGASARAALSTRAAVSSTTSPPTSSALMSRASSLPAPTGSRSTSRPRRRSRTRSRSSSRASTRLRAESRRRRACTSASPTTAHSGRQSWSSRTVCELQLEFANRDSRELGHEGRGSAGLRGHARAFQGVRLSGSRPRRPRHPFRLHRAGGARPGPRSSMRSRSSATRAHPDQS